MDTVNVLTKYGINPVLMSSDPQEFVNQLVTALETLRGQLTAQTTIIKSASVSTFKTSIEVEKAKPIAERAAEAINQVITAAHSESPHSIVTIRETLAGMIKTIDSFIQTHDHFSQPAPKVEKAVQTRGEGAKDFRQIRDFYISMKPVLVFQKSDIRLPNVDALGNVGGNSNSDEEEKWYKKGLQTTTSGWEFLTIDLGEGDGFKNYKWYEIAYLLDIPAFYPKFDYTSWIELFEDKFNVKLGKTAWEFETDSGIKFRYDPNKEKGK